MFYTVVRTLLENMGKTLFFRSGEEPLILSEDQREARKKGNTGSEIFPYFRCVDKQSCFLIDT